MSEKIRNFAYHLKTKKTMNANNQQTSFEPYWLNTKTIVEIIDNLNEIKHTINLLWNDAEGYDDLREETTKAFNHICDTIADMKEVKIVNKLKRKED